MKHKKKNILVDIFQCWCVFCLLLLLLFIIFATIILIGSIMITMFNAAGYFGLMNIVIMMCITFIIISATFGATIVGSSAKP